MAFKLRFWGEILKMSRNFVISGGTSGLGLHLAQTLLMKNDQVIILGRDIEKFESLQRMLAVNQIQAFFVEIDFEKSSEQENYLINKLDIFKKVDVLINNVGASLKVDIGAPVSDFMRVLEINLTSAHILTKIVSEKMLRHKHGRIISIGSMASVTQDGLDPYVIAKTALDAFVVQSAMKFSASGIVHVGIRPGPIAVPGRYLTNLEENDHLEFLNWCKNHKYTPEKLCPMSEISELISFISNSNGTFINGAIINMGGGMF